MEDGDRGLRWRTEEWTSSSCRNRRCQGFSMVRSEVESHHTKTHSSFLLLSFVLSSSLIHVAERQTSSSFSTLGSARRRSTRQVS